MFYKSSHSVHQVATSLGLGYLFAVLGLMLCLHVVQNGVQPENSRAFDIEMRNR